MPTNAMQAKELGRGEARRDNLWRGFENEMPIQAVIALYSCGHPVEVRIIQVAYLSAELLQNRPFSTLDEIGRCFKLNWPVFTWSHEDGFPGVL
jgi:hypothetical protein